jgi:hypothetical protein
VTVWHTNHDFASMDASWDRGGIQRIDVIWGDEIGWESVQDIEVHDEEGVKHLGTQVRHLESKE